MPEKVLFSLRLVETDDGYRVETEGAVPGEAFASRGRAGRRQGCWFGPRQPSKAELREALDSLQSLYDDLYDAE